MSDPNTDSAAVPAPSDFIRDIVARHVAEGRYPRIHTRFPPASKVAFGRNSSALASLPCSSAVNFTASISHGTAGSFRNDSGRSRPAGRTPGAGTLYSGSTSTATSTVCWPPPVMMPLTGLTSAKSHP
jgi:hypothetical protein